MTGPQGVGTVVETDNYAEGAAFSGAAPADVDPTETIEEVVITQSGDDSTMTVTTVSATSFTINLNGGVLALNTLEIDTLSFGGTSQIDGFWVGE